MSENINERIDAIINQGLSREEIRRRLDKIIDVECEFPLDNRNCEIINECLDLQWIFLTGHGYKSNKEVAKKRFERLIQEDGGAGRMNKGRICGILSVACCVIVFILTPLVGQTLLHWEWIEGKSIQNGEIYQLNGAEVDPQTIEAAVADIEEIEVDIVTTDYSRIKNMPQVEQMHIQYIPYGWECCQYYYMNIDGRITYKEMYRSTLEEQSEMVYKCFVFPDTESVNDQIQQNVEGVSVSVGDKMVYFANNYEMTVASWSEGLRSFSLHGPIDESEMIRIIDSVGR